MNTKNKFFLPKDFIIFLFIVSLAIMLTISIFYLDGLFVEYVCDSVSSHDFVVNETERIPNENKVSHISKIYTSFKCRMSWYILDRDNGLYSSYSEYKKNWDTSTRLRDIIKADLARSQAETWASKERKKAYDRAVWESKWERRANEAQRDYERRKAAYENHNK